MADWKQAQKCNYCKQPATKSILHSEGMAYITTCPAHYAKGKHDAEHSTPDGTRDRSNIVRTVDLAISPGGRPADASPLGYKGGPRKLTDYTREIAHALMRRGIPKSKAIAIARGSQARWAAGGGRVRPQVRAAAAASTAEQHRLDYVRTGRRRSLSNPAGSAQDGPRVTIPTMTAAAPARRKRRPGSIAKGPGAGKYPITDQKSVRSAASLLHKGKGVSRAAIVAHVRAEAKRRGLKLTPAFQGGGKSRSLSLQGGGGGGGAVPLVVDLTGPKGYRHGWIYVGGAGLPSHRKARPNPFGGPGGGRNKGGSTAGRQAQVRAEVARRGAASKPLHERVGASESAVQQHQLAAEQLAKHGLRVGDTVSVVGQTEPHTILGLRRNGNVHVGPHGYINRTGQRVELAPHERGQIGYDRAPHTLTKVERAGLTEELARRDAAKAHSALPRNQQGTLSTASMSDRQLRAVAADPNASAADKAAASNVLELRTRRFRDAQSPTERRRTRQSDARFQTRQNSQTGMHEVIDTSRGEGAVVRTFKGKPNASKHANDLNANKTVGKFDRRGAADKIDEQARIRAHAASPASRGTEDLQAMLDGGKPTPGSMTRAQIVEELQRRDARRRTAAAEHQRATDQTAADKVKSEHDRRVAAADRKLQEAQARGERPDSSGHYAHERSAPASEARNPTEYVGRASTTQLEALLSDPRYASWRALVQAELAKRGAGTGTKLTPATRYDGSPSHDVHIDGEKAGHVYKGESRTPVYGRGSISVGHHVAKGYYAHGQRDSGGTDAVGHFKTREAAVRAVEAYHKRRKGK